jgi:hypothetical protein
MAMAEGSGKLPVDHGFGTRAGLFDEGEVLSDVFALLRTPAAGSENAFT